MTDRRLRSSPAPAPCPLPSGAKRGEGSYEPPMIRVKSKKNQFQGVGQCLG